MMPSIPVKGYAGRSYYYYLGIDPGKSGGLALFNPRNGPGYDVELIKMPATERDLWDWFHVLDGLPVKAMIEKVGGYTGEGQPGSAMFNFGKGVGHLEMAMVAASIPFEYVTPQRWQQAMGCGSRRKGESKTSWKNRIKSVAQKLFPKERITLAVSDALLIALYCRRKHEGTL